MYKSLQWSVLSKFISFSAVQVIIWSFIDSLDVYMYLVDIIKFRPSPYEFGHCQKLLFIDRKKFFICSSTNGFVSSFWKEKLSMCQSSSHHFLSIACCIDHFILAPQLKSFDHLSWFWHALYNNYYWSKTSVEMALFRLLHASLINDHMMSNISWLQGIWVCRIVVAGKSTVPSFRQILSMWWVFHESV